MQAEIAGVIGAVVGTDAGVILAGGDAALSTSDCVDVQADDDAGDDDGAERRDRFEGGHQPFAPTSGIPGSHPRRSHAGG